MAIKQAYLGDGVYLKQLAGGQLQVYTSDGIRESNHIYLDLEILESLMQVVARWQESEE